MRRVTQQTLSKLSDPIEALALDLDEVKLQRRIGSSTALASLFRLWIRAATSHFEEQTGRQVMRAGFEYRLDSFPTERFIELPKAPLLTVSSVTYITDGSPAETTFDSDNYTVRAPAGDHCPPGRVELVEGADWPTPNQTPGAVVVTFYAGYAETSREVPSLIQAALMFLVGHMHKYGEEVIGGPEANSLTTLPLGAGSLMRAFKYSALPTQRPWDVTWLE